jgi:alanine racemase
MYGLGLAGLDITDEAGVRRSAVDLLARPLRPAMELAATVASVKRVPAGSGVSYGHDYRTASETTLALIPLGYADGIPRHASGREPMPRGDWSFDFADGSRATRVFGGPLRVGAGFYSVVGRVAMDQFVIDVGDDDVKAGDRAVLFGDPATGAPSAELWATVAGTIDYEIVTRIGPRVPRRYVP